MLTAGPYVMGNKRSAVGLGTLKRISVDWFGVREVAECTATMSDLWLKRVTYFPYKATGPIRDAAD